MSKSRTEIDKDMMYRKIMPSADRKDGENRGTGIAGTGMNMDGTAGAAAGGAAVGRAAVGRAAVGADVGGTAVGAAVGRTAGGAADLGAAVPGILGMPVLSGPNAEHMARSLKRGPVTLPYKEENNMILTNLMEELVLSRLDSTLSRFNCCKCDKCKKDIAALALNRLSPRYAVMKEGDEDKRTKAEKEYGSDVTGALVQAILVVKKNPWH